MIEVDAKTTTYVVLACIIAASGGVLFGYDGGVTGGVESMEQFGRWFFPATTGATSSFYCKYNDHTLQAYSAIMHFTGALASIPASYFTQHWGRKGEAVLYQHVWHVIALWYQAKFYVAVRSCMTVW